MEPAVIDMERMIRDIYASLHKAKPVDKSIEQLNAEDDRLRSMETLSS